MQRITWFPQLSDSMCLFLLSRKPKLMSRFSYNVDTIFEDPGTGGLSGLSKMQTATNAQYYNEKLYLTSCWSDALAICNVGKIWSEQM